MLHLVVGARLALTLLSCLIRLSCLFWFSCLFWPDRLIFLAKLVVDRQVGSVGDTALEVGWPLAIVVVDLDVRNPGLSLSHAEPSDTLDNRQFSDPIFGQDASSQTDLQAIGVVQDFDGLAASSWYPEVIAVEGDVAILIRIALVRLIGWSPSDT